MLPYLESATKEIDESNLPHNCPRNSITPRAAAAKLDSSLRIMVRQIFQAVGLCFKFRIRTHRFFDSWLLVILDKFIAFISKLTRGRWHAARLMKVLGQNIDRPSKRSFSLALASFRNSGEQHYDAIIKHNQ